PRLDMIQVVTPARLGERDGRDCLAGGNLLQHRLALLAARGEQGACQSDGPEEGAGEKRAPEGFHGDHQREPAATDPTDFLRQESADDAHLRQAFPGLAAEAGIGGAMTLALLHRPILLKPPPEAFAEDPLILAEKEILLHRHILRGPARPWPRCCAGSRW